MACVAEGADVLMVKPAMPYLDVIQTLRQVCGTFTRPCPCTSWRQCSVVTSLMHVMVRTQASPLPIAAYQVSGEYAMIKAACMNGWLEERPIVLEALLGIRRAGADIIFTYFARDAAVWLRDDPYNCRPGYRHLDVPNATTGTPRSGCILTATSVPSSLVTLILNRAVLHGAG
eukprot:SAG31_NODE_2342_length_5912_cov_1.363152_9_plen_173_part_00